IEKDYEQAKKYYLMAIDRGNNKAMNNLAQYYKTIEKDYNELYNLYLKYPNMIDLEFTKQLDTKLQYYILKDIKIKEIEEYVIQLTKKSEIFVLYNKLLTCKKYNI